MVKLNRTGQAKCWDDYTIKKLRFSLDSQMQRLIFEISLWTGERMGTIVQLKVSNVYDQNGNVLQYLIYDGKTRKGSRWGTAKTRHVLIHPELKQFLHSYNPPESGYLFPSSGKLGHITRRGVDDYWRRRFKNMGFTGFSTHSSRRWVINQLAKTTRLEIIADTMGMNILTVKHYLDHDPEACDLAMSNLKVA